MPATLLVAAVVAIPVAWFRGFSAGAETARRYRAQDDCYYVHVAAMREPASRELAEAQKKICRGVSYAP